MVSVKKKKQKRWNWLDDAASHEKQGFTFPQVKPSLVYYETPASLSRKVPVVPCPTDVIKLCTTKLGTKRFPVPPDTEFDVADPNMPPMAYNFLHDPHLKEYLNSPLVKKRLHEKGLITKSGHVKCTIKEFNDYRQWVRKLKLDAIDQDWHLRKSEQQNNIKNNINNDATQLTKQRQERAKELYGQKKKKEEKERRRIMKIMAEKEEQIALMKRNRKKKMAQKQKQREDDMKLIHHAKKEKDSSNKKIRLKIFLKSKENIEKCEARIHDLHEAKRLGKEKKAIELWQRRQLYFKLKMDEDGNNKEVDKTKREMSINQRETVYQRERKRSDVYMLQHHQENRDNAIKHLAEASEFLTRIEAKKEREMKKWRAKLKNIEERERLFEYYRQKRTYDERKGKHRKRHDENRKSVWDVDNVLLKHIMNELNDDERKELEILTGVEEEVEDPLERPKSPQPEPVVSPAPINESPVDRLELNLIEKQPSFVRFDKIKVDDTENVYEQDEHHSKYLSPNGSHEMMLDVPGLLIQHCVSVHEHLPVVDSDHDKIELHDRSTEAVLVLDDCKTPKESKVEPDTTKASSYEILVIPSKHSSLDVLIDTPLESRATLIHLIDQEPVMITTAGYSSTSVSETAQKLVQDSLRRAASELGYEESEIHYALGLTPSAGDTTRGEIPMVSKSIINYSKEIAEMSLVAAAMSLGYEQAEISDVLGVTFETEESIKELDEHYSDTVKDMAKTAIKQAAFNLGYSEEETESALSVVLPTQSNSDETISSLASELAKTAILNASDKLGLRSDSSVQTLLDGVVSRVSSMSVQVSNYSIKSNLSQSDEPFAVITHNALRSAALSLGFSEHEINKSIGPEKMLRCGDPMADPNQPDEAEFLIKKHQVVSLTASKIRVDSNSYYEGLSMASELITKAIISSAMAAVTSDASTVLMQNYTPTNSQYELQLQTKAKKIVTNAISNAKMIISNEADAVKEKQMLEERNTVRKFALKYSMMIIGSAAKQLGYSDKSILKALSKDLQLKSGKLSERHPNALVKFNEISIQDAIEENLNGKVQERRASIQARILTPLPSPKESVESVEDDDDGGTGAGDQYGNQLSLERDIPGCSPEKKRRLTPFFPKSVQQKLINEFKNEQKQQFDILEEEEEDEDVDVDKDQQDWSTDFMKKVESLSSPAPLDFSECTEAEMLHQISAEPVGKSDLTSTPVAEYPTETDFLSMVNQQEAAPVPEEAQLMNFLGHNQLAPGILALYNTIQTDVMKLLSSTNIALLSSQSVSPSSTRDEDALSPVSTNPTRPVTPYSPSPLTVGQDVTYNNPARPVFIQSPIVDTKNVDTGTLNKSSESVLPKLDPASSLCLTRRSSSVQKTSKPSPIASKDNVVELPTVRSSLGSNRTCSSTMKACVTKNSSHGKKKDALKCTPSSTLPGVHHSRSVIEVQEKVVNSTTNNDDHKNKQVEKKDSLLNDEVEVVLRAPADFDKSKQFLLQTSEIINPTKEDLRVKISSKFEKSIPSRSSIISIPQQSRISKTSNLVKSTSSVLKQQQTANRISSSSKGFSQNEIPNYAKPLRRSVEKTADVKHITMSIHKQKKEETDGSHSVFERLSKQRRSSVKIIDQEDDSASSMKKTSVSSNAIDRKKKETPSTTVPSVPSHLSRNKGQHVDSTEIKTSRIRTNSMVSSMKSSHAEPIANPKKPSISTTKTSSPKEPTGTAKTKPSKDFNNKSKKDLSARSNRSTSVVKQDDSVLENSESKSHIPKTKSSKKIKKKKSKSSSKDLTKTNSSVSSSKVEDNKKSEEIFRKTGSKLSTRISNKSSVDLKVNGSVSKHQSESLDKNRITSPLMKLQEIDDIDETSNVESSQGVIHDYEQPSAHASVVLDDIREIEDMDSEEVDLKIDLIIKNTLENVGMQLSSRELHDIPENELLSTPTMVPQSIERLSRPQESNFAPIHSSGNVASNVSRVSLTFDEKLTQRRQNSGDLIMRKQSSADAVKSATSNVQANNVANQPSNKDVIYNPSINSMKPTVSAVKFVSSAPSTGTTRQMIVSHSARSIMSNHSNRSSRTGTRSMRQMSKSRSVGSPRLSSTESYIRKYASTPFRESIPNVLDTEYESTKIPSINDVISRRSSAKNAASSSGSNGGVWCPTDSVVRKNSAIGENIHSPSAVLAAPPASKTASNSSFKSTGQIFVTPAASINFVTNNKPNGVSKNMSTQEVVEKVSSNQGQ